jgi:ribosomal protein S18 acetylase RimI-like enzyme
MKIRAATITDSPSLAKIQVDSYQNAYSAILPPAYLAHFSYEEQENDWHDWLSSGTEDILLVAENETGRLAGYGLGGLNADESMPFEAELQALHVLDAFQNQHIGTRLFAAVCARLREKGCRSVFVWVLEQNPARRFYEKLGGQLLIKKAWINNIYFGTAMPGRTCRSFSILHDEAHE